MARIAFVVGEDFEESELRIPYDALREAGHYIEMRFVQKRSRARR
jgi:putative intracellular protease/amidase